MTDRVLTDNDISRVIGETCPLKRWEDAARLARSVEAAVLAKMPHGVYAGYINGYVTEREARKRERAAFEAGARAHGAGTMFVASCIHKHYPLPKCDKCGQELP